ncbi:MAG: hypothetical protein Q8O92_08685 [Candidatus Latescibacter sp.]|nr:hypothetical protein [Candidatus Latescibacter sp.]
MPSLTAKEKKLLSIIQSDIPIVERPYKQLSERIGWSERDVIESIRTLMQNGIIRAFSPVFEARLLGYVSTLVAVEIDKEKVDEFAAALFPINEITHNYLRDHAFAMWFTISAESETVVNSMLSWVEQYPGVRRVMNLPALKVYKVCAVFGETSPHRTSPRKSRMIRPFNDDEIRLVRCLHDGFPLVEYPFRHIAQELFAVEDGIIDTVRDWVEYGIIRRFGARLNHHRAGYIANTLDVWKTDDCDTLGELFASMPWVSHCYRRRSYPDWPYELYTMTHGRSEEELNNHLSHMQSLAPGTEMMILTTLQTLKKTTMKYFPKEGPWDSLKPV